MLVWKYIKSLINMYGFRINVIPSLGIIYSEDEKCHEKWIHVVICSNAEIDADTQRAMKNSKSAKMNVKMKSLDASISDWQLPYYQSTCHISYLMIRALANNISSSITRDNFFNEEFLNS